MRIRSAFLPLIATALLSSAVGVGCAQSISVSEEETLQYVLEQSRVAMQDVETYRSRTTTVSTDSRSDFSTTSRGVTERQTHDRYRFRTEALDDFDGYYLEAIVLGHQSFTRESSPDWQEQQPVFYRGEPVSPAEVLLSYLNLEGVELVSSNEVMDDGRAVYRLEVTETSERLVAGPDNRPAIQHRQVETRKTSLLIDKESFRIVARVFDTLWESYFYDVSSNEPPEYAGWDRMVDTEEVYDYNASLVIEPPDEYVPWPGKTASRS